MANYVFGQAACGRIVQLADNVILNTPANSAIIWVPMATVGTAEQAEALTSLQAVESDANFSEQAGTGWSRVTQDDAGDGLAVSWDATNNRMEVDSNDIVWAGPSVGNTLGLLACYDSDTAAGTDANIIPLCHFDMAVTQNGQQVTFQQNAEGWHNATRT